LLEIDVFSRRGTDLVAFTRPESPAAHQNLRFLRTAFLHRLTEQHDLADTEVLVDAGGYDASDTTTTTNGPIKRSTAERQRRWSRTSQCQCCNLLLGLGF